MKRKNLSAMPRVYLNMPTRPRAVRPGIVCWKTKAAALLGLCMTACLLHAQTLPDQTLPDQALPDQALPDNSAATEPETPPAETLTFDIPRIDVLEFFGLRNVTRSLVTQALGASEGGPLPASRGDAEQRINQVDRVAASHLEAVCCEEGLTILYVGIEERGSPHFAIRESPGGAITLPNHLLSAYNDFLAASRAAALRGSTAEDLTQGHSLMADFASRKLQESFPALAEANLDTLRAVIHESSDGPQRAAATYLIGYYPDKRVIVDELQFALRDADPSVRANAVSGLTALSVLARLHPESQLRISPTWFIEMLNSLSFSDRNRALWALQLLTEERDDAVLQQLRDRAIDSLAEMARWKILRHALPAFILLGRAGEIPETEIQDAWSRGDRETVIESVLKQINR